MGAEGSKSGSASHEKGQGDSPWLTSADKKSIVENVQSMADASHNIPPQALKVSDLCGDALIIVSLRY